jgi:hypothetical protein
MCVFKPNWHQDMDDLIVIAFVQTQLLRFSGRFRPCNHQLGKRLFHQLHVMPFCQQGALAASMRVTGLLDAASTGRQLEGGHAAQGDATPAGHRLQPVVLNNCMHQVTNTYKRCFLMENSITIPNKLNR